MLYPIMTESRLLLDLDGIWRFAKKETQDPDDIALVDFLPIPVPASYNDLYPSASLRDYVGEVIYERDFTVNPQMLTGRLVLRFGSVTHHARVYINGTCVSTHKGGFLPFEMELHSVVRLGQNVVRVIVDNRLDFSTLPVGWMTETEYPELGVVPENMPNFDFFNYAGIMRPVKLYTTPKAHIEQLRVNAQPDGSVRYEAECTGIGSLEAAILDRQGNTVAEAVGLEGSCRIENPILWEPGKGYLYRLRVLYRCGRETDVYELAFGVRGVEIKGCQFLINGKPFYFKGFGKHEDSPIHGRGLDEALNIKDIGLMRWIGANSLRTSHYPYSEEMLMLCDREGIVVIGESPAVGLHVNFSATGLSEDGTGNTWKQLQTANHHREVLAEMVRRDENHPCVVMWSLANEPASEEDGAYEYFEPLYRLVKEQDWQKRPVTIVTYEGSKPDTCKVAGLVDILAINRYYGWYNYCGQIKIGAAVLGEELRRWHELFPNKPMMFCEYGADAISGMHSEPSAMFTEEFQSEFLIAYHKLFDSFSWLVGEHVWNFADFATAQNTMRVLGNKKGVFTRDRQPKAAAHTLRARWLAIPDFYYKKEELWNDSL